MSRVERAAEGQLRGGCRDAQLWVWVQSQTKQLCCCVHVYYSYNSHQLTWHPIGSTKFWLNLSIDVLCVCMLCSCAPYTHAITNHQTFTSPILVTPLTTLS